MSSDRVRRRRVLRDRSHGPHRDRLDHRGSDGMIRRFLAWITSGTAYPMSPRDPFVTYADPAAWMSEEQRRFHQSDQFGR